MSKALDKDPAIFDVLDRLRLRLGSDCFVVTDHWEPDLCAVGISSPSNPGVLVYISTYNESPNRYGYELETPPPAGSDALYEVAGRGSDISFEELANVVADHLSRADQ